MKKKYYAVYNIDEHTFLKMSLVQLGFECKEAAMEAIEKYGGGKFIIQEYYE